MKISSRLLRRIWDELRLWLKSRHGIRSRYSQQKFDRGRGDLGFGTVEDALVVYVLFGAGPLPHIATSPDTAVAAAGIGDFAEYGAGAMAAAMTIMIDGYQFVW